MANWPNKKKTREEILSELIEMLEYQVSPSVGYDGWGEDFSIIMVQAIELFKKDTEILAKIKQAREEIENLEVQIQSYHNDDPMISQTDVLKIIDKLIAESEGVNV